MKVLKQWHVGKLKKYKRRILRVFLRLANISYLLVAFHFLVKNNDLQLSALYVANSASELLPPFSVYSH